MSEEKLPHWIEENKRPKSYMWVCSECGSTAYDMPMCSKKGYVKICSLSYCPHCGAKMIGEQQEVHERDAEDGKTLTCFKCHGAGTYPVPIDPDYSWDECKQVKCEVCGGTGKITLKAYEWFQKGMRGDKE